LGPVPWDAQAEHVHEDTSACIPEEQFDTLFIVDSISSSSDPARRTQLDGST
jgi:hypothetical protein